MLEGAAGEDGVWSDTGRRTLYWRNRDRTMVLPGRRAPHQEPLGVVEIGRVGGVGAWRHPRQVVDGQPAALGHQPQLARGEARRPQVGGDALPRLVTHLG